MYKIKNFVKARKIEIIITTLVLIMIIGVSYAWIRKTVTSSNKNVLMTGNLRVEIQNEDPLIKAGGEDGYAIPLENTEGLATTPYTFTIKNTGNITTIYEITLLDTTGYTETYEEEDQYGNKTYGYRNNEIAYGAQRIADSNIRFNIREGTSTNTVTQLVGNMPNRVLTSGIIEPKEEKTFNLRIWVDINATLNDIDNRTFAANLSIKSTQGGGSRNPHIKGVYEYNENGTGTGKNFTGCLGGSEAGCIDIKGTKTDISSYAVGTVIKYEVSPGVEKYFNVLHDDGTTLTLQHRENTVSSKAWYGTSSNYTTIYGPSLESNYALGALEQATSGWTNVNTQTYSIGDNTTTLGYSGTNSKQYTLERTAKARMITVQEAKALGCTTTTMSCPKFISNHLVGATNYGGTFEAGNQFYWSMSAFSSNRSWSIRRERYIRDDTTYNRGNGARAVVVINK